MSSTSSGVAVCVCGSILGRCHCKLNPQLLHGSEPSTPWPKAASTEALAWHLQASLPKLPLAFLSVGPRQLLLRAHRYVARVSCVCRACCACSSCTCNNMVPNTCRTVAGRLPDSCRTVAGQLPANCWALGWVGFGFGMGLRWVWVGSWSDRPHTEKRDS